MTCKILYNTPYKISHPVLRSTQSDLTSMNKDKNVSQSDSNFYKQIFKNCVLSPGYCLLQIWCSHMYFIPSRVSLNRLLALSWNMQTTKTQTYTRPWLCLQRRPLKHLGSLVIKKHTSKLPAKILAEIILLVYWKITRTGYCWILFSVW